jgi:hypothetical protein
VPVAAFGTEPNWPCIATPELEVALLLLLLLPLELLQAAMPRASRAAAPAAMTRALRVRCVF